MQAPSSFLARLNEPQQRAVQALGGPVLVLAGPGSGKTRVLTHRVAYLIGELRIDPYKILAVTFTNKAAKEMKERLQALIGEEMTKRLMVGTFHSVCVRILRADIERLGRRRDFVVYDDDDQIQLMRRVIKELNLDEKQYPPRAVHGAISRAKNELVGPAELARLGRSYWDEIVTRCYERYTARLEENNALDFDDLLLLTVRLFQRHPETLRKYQQRFVHVLIDEFQDVNTCQYEFAKLISGHHNHLFVVGDEDQSVYAFRGANMRYVLQFEDDFPDAKVIILEQNYRSTQAILDVASQLIAAGGRRKHPKQLWTQNDRGVLVSLQEAYTEEEEAALVLDEIERLRGKGALELKDCAVLYRTNAQSRAMEEALIRRNMKYRLIGGVRFYERKEVKDILAYLRVVSNPLDSVALFRVINVPPRGIGERTVADLNDWSADLGVPTYTALQLLGENETPSNGEGDGAPLAPTVAPPFTGRTRNALIGFLRLTDGLIKLRDELALVDLLDLVLERTGYHDALVREHGDEDGETRWENVLELRTVATQYANFPRDAQLATFLEEIALVAATDDLDPNQDAVTLITMHQAKGLEYPAVFVVGLEEGLVPHSRSLEDPEQLEEERRLLYVAATRAKERLYLLHAFKRTMYGRTNIATPSRFLGDIPPDLLKRARERGERSGFGQSSIFTSRSSWGTGQATGREAGARGRAATSWGAGARKNTTPLKPVPGAKFTSGMRVRHANFGEGVVVSSTSAADDEEVTVAFVGQGIKKLLAGFAKLEVVKE
ncbi:MAG: ATP-dependent DNA helicase UvrD/PcrA [uncultured Chloroflexia bacterium]|uniref:DNA 3'-5' helicase n=1 Tax=uncultured Chloroflexia bacterium TaxID=1672391 RepID=A0A6J4K242_9CHLR|nr:MAG: ATP-dependent DNA helicase UvrD/PcrA [uncultured Chloroflexia bacterium]